MKKYIIYSNIFKNISRHMENCLTITQLNTLAKEMLEEIEVWVRGEVSGCSPDKYYYIYFDLKDEGAKIKCIFPSQKAKTLDFKFGDSIVVKAFGKLSIYEKEGQYQFKAERIEKDGEGDLQAKIEEIKDRLQKEGLLDESRKRSLPQIPQKIAVLSSKDSAAWKDFYKILNSRYPNLEILLYDVLVQGDKAAKDIIKGLKYINTLEDIDLIVITRGGGSLEDLMAFNDEALARAICDSNYPVVSAIGHEKDISISDLVADLRASTPSNAAELISPDISTIYQNLDGYLSKMKKVIIHSLDVNKLNLENIISKSPIQDFKRLFQIRYDELNNLAKRIGSNKRILDNYEYVINDSYKKIYTNINYMIKNYKDNTSLYFDKLKELTNCTFENQKLELKNIELKLKLNNPLQILKKGYSISTTKSGKIVTDIKQIKVGETIETQLSNGIFSSNILNIKK